MVALVTAALVVLVGAIAFVQLSAPDRTLIGPIEIDAGDGASRVNDPRGRGDSSPPKGSGPDVPLKATHKPGSGAEPAPIPPPAPAGDDDEDDGGDTGTEDDSEDDSDGDEEGGDD